MRVGLLPALVIAACGGQLGADDDSGIAGDGAQSKDGAAFDGAPFDSSAQDGSTQDATSVCPTLAACDAASPPTCDGCAPPVVLAGCQNIPAVLLMDGNSIYWQNLGTDLGGGGNVPIEYDNGNVGVCNKSSCAPGEVVGSLRHSSTSGLGLVIAGERLFVDALNYTDAGASVILGLNLNACTDTPETTIGGYANAIASSDSTLYWANQNVWSCEATNCTMPIVFWAAQAGIATAIATDEARVYWATNTGRLMSCPLSGCVGPPTTLVMTNATFDNYMVLDSANVYASSSKGILKCAKAGCATPITITPITSGSGPLATDGINVYWTDVNVYKCSVDGCASPTVVATGAAATGIAVDETSVYWTDTILGTVLSVPKSAGLVATSVKGGDNWGVGGIQVYLTGAAQRHDGVSRRLERQRVACPTTPIGATDVNDGFWECLQIAFCPNGTRTGNDEWHVQAVSVIGRSASGRGPTHAFYAGAANEALGFEAPIVFNASSLTHTFALSDSSCP